MNKDYFSYGHPKLFYTCGHPSCSGKALIVVKPVIPWGGLILLRPVKTPDIGFNIQNTGVVNGIQSLYMENISFNP